ARTRKNKFRKICSGSKSSSRPARFKRRPYRHRQHAGRRSKMKQSTLTLAAALAGGAYLCKQIARSMRRIDFHGRHVLITGGSRGLGLVLARELASEGATITILARDAE